jgi:hypothetical protein
MSTDSVYIVYSVYEYKGVYSVYEYKGVYREYSTCATEWEQSLPAVTTGPPTVSSVPAAHSGRFRRLVLDDSGGLFWTIPRGAFDPCRLGREKKIIGGDDLRNTKEKVVPQE